MVCRSQFGFLATLFPLFFFQLSLLKTPVSDAERLLLREPPSSGHSASCKYWSTAVRSPRVIFCQVEPDDSQIKTVSSALPVVLDNNGHANPRVSSPVTNEREDYVIFMDSEGENLLEECVSAALPSSLLNEHTALIVCDRSTEFPRKLQKMESTEVPGTREHPVLDPDGVLECLTVLLPEEKILKSIQLLWNSVEV